MDTERVLHLLRDPVTGLVVGVVGVVIGIVGSVIGIAGFRAAHRSIRPTWLMRTVTLVDERATSLLDLSIQHGGEEVASLSLTRIAFWNAGRDVIWRQDLDRAPERLAITADPGVRVLTSQVVVVSESENTITVRKHDGRRLTIDFAYLKHREGAVIEVVHTGMNSDALKFTGSVGDLITARGEAALVDGHTNGTIESSTLPWLLGAGTSAALFIVLAALTFRWPRPDTSVSFGVIAVMCMGVYGLIWAISAWSPIPHPLNGYFFAPLLDASVNVKTYRLLRRVLSYSYEQAVFRQLRQLVSIIGEGEVVQLGRWRDPMIRVESHLVAVEAWRGGLFNGRDALPELIYIHRERKADAILLVFKESNEKADAHLQRMGPLVGVPVQVVEWHPDSAAATLERGLHEVVHLLNAMDVSSARERC